MKSEMNKIIEMVLEDAHDKEMSAAYGGQWYDGGAGHLRELVKFYKYGVEGVVPPEWASYAKKLDTDYPEYCRLKAKFEGRS